MDLLKVGTKPSCLGTLSSFSGTATGNPLQMNRKDTKLPLALAFRPVGTAEPDNCCVTHFVNLVHFLRNMLIRL